MSNKATAPGRKPEKVFVDGIPVNEVTEPRDWPVFVEVYFTGFGKLGFIREALKRFKLMEQLGYKAVEADAVKVGNSRHVLFVRFERGKAS